MDLYIHCAESKCAQLYSKFYSYIDHCVSLWGESYLSLAFIHPFAGGIPPMVLSNSVLYESTSISLRIIIL